jgi:hypothetical protein
MREINISNISAILISAVYSEHQADFSMRNRVVICIIIRQHPVQEICLLHDGNKTIQVNAAFSTVAETILLA